MGIAKSLFPFQVSCCAGKIIGRNKGWCSVKGLIFFLQVMNIANGGLNLNKTHQGTMVEEKRT